MNFNHVNMQRGRVKVLLSAVRGPSIRLRSGSRVLKCERMLGRWDERLFGARKSDVSSETKLRGII